MADNSESKPILTRRDLEARIVARAWREPNYKQRLLQNPKSVLLEQLQTISPSVELPAALNVAVHEEAADQYHLVLPRNPTEITLHDLAGENLEALAPQTVAVVVLGPAVAQIVNVVATQVNTSVVTNVVGPASVVVSGTFTAVA